MLVPEGRPGAGGTILLLQKWAHDAAEWEALPVQSQEAVIGRTKPDSVELEPRPDDSHVASTDQDRFGKIFRRNMPYGTVSDHGTMFVGFSAAQRPLAAMLESMAGLAGGTRDALTRYTTPLTGAYYFVPSIEALQQASGSTDQVLGCSTACRSLFESSFFIWSKPNAQSMTAMPSTTFQIVRIASCVIENAAMLLEGGVGAQRGDVERLRLTDAARRDRKEPGEHVRGRDEEDRERGDGDAERGHEDDVDADATDVRRTRRQRDLTAVASPVAEDRGALLGLVPLVQHAAASGGARARRARPRPRRR